MTAVIEASELRKQYGHFGKGHRALDGATFTVQTGRIVGL